MIESLSIRNYRNLKDLELNTLGQINLITGKNNTGKSSILEALSIYVSNADLSIIRDNLRDRGEIINYNTPITKGTNDQNIRILSSLFTDRKFSFNESEYIQIRAIEKNSLDIDSHKTMGISLGFVKYIVEKFNDQDAVVSRRRKILDSDNSVTELSDIRIGFEIKVNENSDLIPLDRDSLFSRHPYRFRPNSNNIKVQYIKTRNIDRDINGNLFDNIALTEKELNVIDALKIIEPNIERLAFIEEVSNNERSAVVKLSNKDKVYPLKSMGDGINRILTIILAIVNCENGYVLIDEFENGLHYSIQNSLWKIIFYLAEKLNIQIFATTHSEDCINGFENALNNLTNNEKKGKLIRLDYDNEVLKEVVFNSEELKLANSLNIETR